MDAIALSKSKADYRSVLQWHALWAFGEASTMSKTPLCKSLMKSWPSPLTPLHLKAKFTFMENPDFDQLLKSYMEAVDHWVDAIHAEEALATDDHSMVEMELWDDAGFKLQDAEAVAKKARDAYKNALRKKNYGF
jgi:hypothetical protein